MSRLQEKRFAPFQQLVQATDRHKDATSRAESGQAQQKGDCCSDWQLQFPWLSFHSEAKATHVQSKLNQFKQ